MGLFGKKYKRIEAGTIKNEDIRNEVESKPGRFSPEQEEAQDNDDTLEWQVGIENYIKRQIYSIERRLAAIESYLEKHG